MMLDANKQINKNFKLQLNHTQLTTIIKDKQNFSWDT